MNRTKNNIQKGFTLLELLIVLAILAILAVVLIIVLNPAETLKRSRDAQRLSDLSSLKTALGIYVTSVNNPDLGDNVLANHCLGSGNDKASISYSFNTGAVGDVACTSDDPPGSDAGGSVFSSNIDDQADFCRYVDVTVDSSVLTAVNGNGWIPVDFTSISGGSPIASLPLDPTNSVANVTTPQYTDLVYRYACQMSAAGPSIVFELNAQLESNAYTIAPNDKRKNDGGDHPDLFEIGSSVRLMGSGSNF